MRILKYLTSPLFSFLLVSEQFLFADQNGCDLSMTCVGLDPLRVYDFVIIGTGPASGPVIRRLVDKEYSVIVLEKGPYFFPPSLDSKADGDTFDDTFQIREDAIEWEAPAFNISNHSISQIELEVYGIESETQLASRKREYPYKQMQGFGGQTLTYGGISMRPSPAAFDKWPNITFEEMLPWYKKSEAYSWACGQVANASEAHSCGNFSGFMSVLLQNESAYPKLVEVVPAFCAAGANAANPQWLDTTDKTDVDYNGIYATRAFCGPPQMFLNKTTNTDRGIVYERGSLQQTYLPCDYLQSRKEHLKLCVNAKVTRLLLDANNRVTAAVLDGLGVTIKGVRFIIASGVRFTPQLLMSSGIGNATELGVFGIKTNIPLPDVGRYFHDEWAFAVSFKIRNSNATAWTLPESKLNRDQMQLVKWSTGAQGDNFTDVQLYLRLGNELSSDDYLPESFKMGISAKGHDSFAIRVSLFQNDTFGATSGVFPVGSNGLYIDRFTFRIKMFDNANKSNRFIQGAVNGYNKAMELVELMRNQSLNGEKLQLQAIPSCSLLINAANQGVQPFAQVLWDFGNVLALHGGGTCGIGRVVDSNLKVFNTSNLYVSDMSVFPFPVDANPTATLYALGERLAVHLLSLPSETVTTSLASEPTIFSEKTFGFSVAGAWIGGVLLGMLGIILPYRFQRGHWIWNVFNYYEHYFGERIMS